MTKHEASGARLTKRQRAARAKKPSRVSNDGPGQGPASSTPGAALPGARLSRSALDPLLIAAVAAGVMTKAEARDVDAFADGVCARLAAGELTPGEADELVAATATRDAQARLRSRARKSRA